MKLHSVSLLSLPTINYETFFCETEGREERILLLAFYGKYGLGSEGNSEGRFMTAIASGTLAACLPDALVLDLREFEYSFGNTLLEVFNVGRDEKYRWIVPTRIVVSKKCREGVETLLDFAKRDRTAVLYDTVEAAVESILREFDQDVN